MGLNHSHLDLKGPGPLSGAIGCTLNVCDLCVPHATQRHHQLWQGLVWEIKILFSSPVSLRGFGLESGGSRNGT